MKDVWDALCSRLTNLEQCLGTIPAASGDVILVPTQEAGPPQGDGGSVLGAGI